MAETCRRGEAAEGAPLPFDHFSTDFLTFDHFLTFITTALEMRGGGFASPRRSPRPRGGARSGCVREFDSRLDGGTRSGFVRLNSYYGGRCKERVGRESEGRVEGGRGPGGGVWQAGEGFGGVGESGGRTSLTSTPPKPLERGADLG